MAEQRVFIMRHGERLDTKQPSWKRTAPRPYDTPLTRRGHTEALQLVKQRLTDKDIKKVISSPFLRCLQTAQQACNALNLPGVHVCSGLCESLVKGNMDCQPEVPAMEDISDISILTFDPSPLPDYPEQLSSVHGRYLKTFQQLADQHWPENLLLVTHEVCVRDSVAWGGCTDDVEATYCGQVELVRSEQNNHDKWTLVDFHGVYKYDII